MSFRYNRQPAYRKDAAMDHDCRKKWIYAAARIPVYWIINLIDKQVEVYKDPTGPGKKPDHRKRQNFKKGESIPVILDGKRVGLLAVSQILP
jgi:Uma2 family endonuclease